MKFVDFYNRLKSVYDMQFKGKNLSDVRYKFWAEFKEAKAFVDV